MRLRVRGGLTSPRRAVRTPEWPELTRSPTLSLAATQQGLILGTAGYMAPEQARERPRFNVVLNWIEEVKARATVAATRASWSASL